jgi:hypothetical protein
MADNVTNTPINGNITKYKGDPLKTLKIHESDIKANKPISCISLIYRIAL